MERQVNDYVYAALGFAVISLFGSLLSFLNIISLLTTYQFLLEARKRGINEKLDKIIEIYQEYDYCVVPYRLNKDKPIADAFFDIKLNYDHVIISGGDGTIDLIVNTMKELDIDIPIGILP